MKTFQLGETVICSLEIKNTAGNYVVPDTSVTISIWLLNDSIRIVNDAAMTPDAVGKYHYDYTATGTIGRHAIRFKAVDAGRTTIKEDEFILQD